MHNSTSKKSSICLFLLGLFLFTEIRIIGSAGISEVVCYIVAPFLFIKDYLKLKRDGFVGILWLLVLTMLGCVISSKVNSIYWMLAVKGFAIPYTMFSLIVVLHNLLRSNMNGLRWLLVGLAISNVVCIFIFQRGTESVENGQILTGEAAVEYISNGALFWTSRLSAFLSLPIRGWYLLTPLAYSISEPIAISVFTMLTTVSGRSVALISLTGVLMMLLGRKSKKTMRLFGKRFFIYMAVLAMGGALFKYVYVYTAKSGMLGEEQREKYERQSRSGSSMLRLLMSGRSELFVCLFAGLDRPLLGHGPKAPDTNHYYETFLAKYGDAEDYEHYGETCRRLMAEGYSEPPIPAHSGIGAFWVWYGVFGLLFYLYVLFKIFVLMRYHLDAIPQWYGYFCLGVPATVWSVLFSPPERFGISLLMTLVLLAIAVGRKRLELSIDMQREILSHS